MNFAPLAAFAAIAAILHQGPWILITYGKFISYSIRHTSFGYSHADCIFFIGKRVFTNWSQGRHLLSLVRPVQNFIPQLIVELENSDSDCRSFVLPLGYSFNWTEACCI
jgi:Na+/H+-dicarboxylate symporter